MPLDSQASSHASAPAGGFRKDIQGLRAVAVLTVLIFHVFPSALPGGYVGVDVFFVISGFLISSALMKESTRTGRVSLRDFYERRIRRLMPAATLVLFASAIGCLIFLPPLRWTDSAYQLLASAFYVENWYLYFQSVDYLRADALPSPFQHYWSLSIEEQFYFVWPLLILFGGLVATRLKIDSKVIWGTIFAAVFLGSLACSVVLTPQNQSAAYFTLWTRIWELALGGAVAQFGGRDVLTGGLRAILTWIALAVVLASAYVFTEASMFPGYIALAPTVATAVLLLVGANSGAFSTGLVLRLPIMQFFGDISYSLYLWHWPGVIFAKAHLGRDFTFLEGVGIMAIAVFLSALTKRGVEDVFRHRSPNGSGLRVVIMFIVCALISVAGALALYIPASNAAKRSAAQVVEYGDYPGAAALYADAPTPVPSGPPFIPDLIVARKSYPELYTRHCHVPREGRDLIPCVFPPAEEASANGRTIMLVGDSHAAHWLPALRLIAAEKDWTIITHTKSSCPVLDADLFVANSPYPECRAWVQAVRADIIERKPDLAVTAMISNYAVVGSSGQEDNQQKLAKGLERAWSPILDAGIPIMAIEGTPRMVNLVPECLAGHPDDTDQCGRPANEALEGADTVKIAAQQMDGRVGLIDMNSGICSEDFCAPIVGNMIVYRDQNHLTVEFSKSLAPLLERQLPYLD
jgi:peptidoglycan/LPS O-acetylase OafA/YrhL